MSMKLRSVEAPTVPSRSSKPLLRPVSSLVKQFSDPPKHRIIKFTTNPSNRHLSLSTGHPKSVITPGSVQAVAGQFGKIVTQKEPEPSYVAASEFSPPNYIPSESVMPEYVGVYGENPPKKNNYSSPKYRTPSVSSHPYNNPSGQGPKEPKYVEVPKPQSVYEETPPLILTKKDKKEMRKKIYNQIKSGEITNAKETIKNLKELGTSNKKLIKIIAEARYSSSSYTNNKHKLLSNLLNAVKIHRKKKPRSQLPHLHRISKMEKRLSNKLPSNKNAMKAEKEELKPMEHEKSIGQNNLYKNSTNPINSAYSLPNMPQESVPQYAQAHKPLNTGYSHLSTSPKLSTNSKYSTLGQRTINEPAYASPRNNSGSRHNSTISRRNPYNSPSSFNRSRANSGIYSNPTTKQTPSQNPATQQNSTAKQNQSQNLVTGRNPVTGRPQMPLPQGSQNPSTPQNPATTQKPRNPRKQNPLYIPSHIRPNILYESSSLIPLPTST